MEFSLSQYCCVLSYVGPFFVLTKGTTIIKVLVDVRKNPISMKYGFSKTKLAEYTRIAGITYIHIADLGIPSDLRQDLHNQESYQRLFDVYFTQILPNHLG